jgi:hypothetical protein
MPARSLLLLALLAIAGCYSQTPPSRLASLRVLAEPSTTTVYVDDRYVGSARVLATRPKVFKPGIKFITFKAPDHFPHDVRVDLPPGTTTIKMKLRPIPP